MTSPFDTGRWWSVLAVTVFAFGCFGLAGRLAPAPVLVNESPSVPRGLYARDPGASLRPGVFVATPQPPLARAYLAGLGMPSGVRLLKRVAAAGGDVVCRRGDRLQVGPRVVRVAARDRRGAGLPAWSGCRRLTADEVFLLGDTPGSFDSRYFGPVRVSDVDGVFREVMTW
jgi:type IV secretory pathway protease TraF